jgi:PCRF domain
MRGTAYIITAFLVAAARCYSFNFKLSSGRYQTRAILTHIFSSVSPGVDINALPDSKRRLGELAVKVDSNLAKDVMNLPQLRQSVRDMEQESSQPNFWDDQAKAQSLLSEMNRVKELIQRAETWQRNCDDVGVLLDMAVEDPSGAGSSPLTTPESCIYPVHITTL